VRIESCGRYPQAGAEIFGAGHNALGGWLWLGEHEGLGPLTTPQTFSRRLVPTFCLLILRKSTPGFTVVCGRPLCACWSHWAMWIRWRRHSGSIHAKSCLSQHRARRIPVPLSVVRHS
jgi:hypothetical protein